MPSPLRNQECQDKDCKSSSSEWAWLARCKIRCKSVQHPWLAILLILAVLPMDHVAKAQPMYNDINRYHQNHQRQSQRHNSQQSNSMDAELYLDREATRALNKINRLISQLDQDSGNPDRLDQAELRRVFGSGSGSSSGFDYESGYAAPDGRFYPNVRKRDPEANGENNMLSLSIVNNMDVLRAKLMRELLQRRENIYHQSWINRNQKILNTVG